MTECIDGIEVHRFSVQCYAFGIDGHVGVDRYELFRQKGHLAGRFELGSQRGPFDSVQIGIDILDRVVLLYQWHGRFLAHTLHTGHVVGRITDQRQHVDHVVGLHPKLLLHLRRIVDFVFADILTGTQHLHLVIHQLEVVFVRRNAQDLMSVHRFSLRDRTNDVIGFEAGHFDALQPHHRDQLLDTSKLRHQIIGKGIAMGLVLIVHLVSKRRFLRVEHHGNSIRIVLVQQRRQHVGKGKHGKRRLTGIRLHSRALQRMVGSKHKGHCIN